MGRLEHHVGANGVVTNQALIAASEELTKDLARKAKEADKAGDTRLAAEWRRLIDKELDQQKKLKRRI